MSELPLPNTRRRLDGSTVYTITKLRKVLLSVDIPNYQVGSLAGIHPYQLSLYAQGKKDISDKHLKALAQVLNLPISDLVGTEEYLLDDPPNL